MTFSIILYGNHVSTYLQSNKIFDVIEVNDLLTFNKKESFSILALISENEHCPFAENLVEKVNIYRVSHRYVDNFGLNFEN